MPAKLVKTAKLKPRGKAFEKGNRANPNGRPVAELTFSSQLRRKLAEQYTGSEYEEAVSNMEAMVDDFIDQYWTAKTVQEKAMVLDRAADRTEGKPQQKVDHTTLGKEMPTPIYGGQSMSTELSTSDEE